MTPTIELVQVGEPGLLLDDVRSVKGEGKSKRLGFLPRTDNAILRFVVPLKADEAALVHAAVVEQRKALGMAVSDRILSQMEPAELAKALKKGKR